MHFSNGSGQLLTCAVCSVGPYNQIYKCEIRAQYLQPSPSLYWPQRRSCYSGTNRVETNYYRSPPSWLSGKYEGSADREKLE